MSASISIAELKKFASAVAAIVARDQDVAQYEVYCASADHRIARIAYTSDIACRGLEEMKSIGADGFQMRLQHARKTGLGCRHHPFLAASLPQDVTCPVDEPKPEAAGAPIDCNVASLIHR